MILALFRCRFLLCCTAIDSAVYSSEQLMDEYRLKDILPEKVVLGYIRKQYSKYMPDDIPPIIYPYCQMYKIEERTVRYSNGDIKAILIANTTSSVGYIGFISAQHYNAYKAISPNEDYIVQFYNTGKILKQKNGIKNYQACYLEHATYIFWKQDTKIVKIFILFNSDNINQVFWYIIAFDITQQKKLALWDCIGQKELPEAKQVSCRQLCVRYTPSPK